MKILVMVDMEGISGIVCSEQVGGQGPKYAEARRFLTEEANACVRGCLAGGATEVMVRDAHGTGHNFIWDQLDGRATYVQGNSPAERLPGIAACDGMILLGYHALAGTAAAVLEHTMSSAHWQNFWLNGRLTGEIGIDAAFAGDHGVPTIMVSGDDKACAEARDLLPGVVTAEVKRGLATEGAVLLPAERARELIEQKAADAVTACKGIAPLQVEHPVTLRLEKVERGGVPTPGSKPYLTVIDGRTYEVTGGTMAEAYGRLY